MGKRKVSIRLLLAGFGTLRAHSIQNRGKDLLKNPYAVAE